MARVRISTTVDEARLARSRLLLDAPDSQLLDRALQALIDELEGVAEIRALESAPYEEDPDLAWEVSEGPPLPYDGAVPKEVLAKARARRRRRR
ncbi:MAG: hypothetical protein WEB06_21195 [Actinomycetota bacterium]